jgi:hypothetical protein
MRKKGMSLQEFSGLALAFVLCAIIISVGGTILAQTQAAQCTGGTAGYAAGECGTGGSAYNTSTIASNATRYGLQGITSMSNWMPTIAVIIAAAVVIGVIVRYFQGQN